MSEKKENTKGVFLEKIEFENAFGPFEKGTKIYFNDGMRNILKFYFKQKGIDEKVADRMKINVIVGENGTGKTKLLSSLNFNNTKFIKKECTKNIDDSLTSSIVSNLSIFDILSINGENDLFKKDIIGSYIAKNIYNDILYELINNAYILSNSHKGTVFFSLNSVLVNYYKLVLTKRLKLFGSIINDSFDFDLNKQRNFDLIFSLENNLPNNDISSNDKNIDFLFSITTFLTEIIRYLNSGNNFTNFSNFINKFTNKGYLSDINKSDLERFNEDITDLENDLQNNLDVYLIIYEIFEKKFFGNYFVFWLPNVIKISDDDTLKEIIKQLSYLCKELNDFFNKNIEDLLNINFDNKKLKGLFDKLLEICNEYRTGGDNYNNINKKDFLFFYEKRYYSDHNIKFYENLLTPKKKLSSDFIACIKEYQHKKYFGYNRNTCLGGNHDIPIIFSDKVLEKVGCEQGIDLFTKQYDNKYLFLVHDILETNSHRSLYYGLSSGQKKILTDFVSFLSYLYTHKHIKNFIILIDEPDLHLHLDWQRQYIQKLIDVFGEFLKDQKDIGLHFIIATHSPFILSDIPAENVILLQKGKDGFTKVTDWWGRTFDWLDNNFIDKPKNDGTFGANFVDLIRDGFFFQSKNLMGSFAEGIIDKIAEERRQEIANGKEIDKDIIKGIEDKIGDSFLKDNLLYFKKSDAEDRNGK